MGHTKGAHVRKIETRAGAERAPTPLRVAAAASPPAVAELPGLATARVEAVEGDEVHLVVAGQQVIATRDPSVHVAVLTGARDRGERVLCERGAGGAWVVIGALKVAPIPGIDVADSYTIEADRVTIRSGGEITLSTVTAALVLRAAGEVETYAERIISRAEGVHKIIGRMLRLN